MNQIHASFEIPNELFVYVLSTMVFEPVRWNQRVGWRPSIETERLASFEFWRQVGTRMAIRDIPASYDELEAFNLEFERTQFGYTDAGARVAAATRDMFLDWFPGLPRRVGRPLVHALLDEPLLDALGFPRPSRFFRLSVEVAARTRSRIVRALPPRRRPRIRTEEKHRSYPQGYELETLGPAAQRDYSGASWPRSSVDRAADFESARGGSIPPGAIVPRMEIRDGDLSAPADSRLSASNRPRVDGRGSKQRYATTTSSHIARRCDGQLRALGMRQWLVRCAARSDDRHEDDLVASARVGSNAAQRQALRCSAADGGRAWGVRI